MGLKLMGNKIGMTQIFNEDGSVVPVTVLRVGPCVVVDKKTASRNGYCALVLGYGDVKESRLGMSELGLYRKAGIEPKGRIVESRVSAEELDRYEIGQKIDLSLFNKGDHVDVTGTSKGRGFTGVIRRHGMSGAKSSHGAHEYFRHGGSIGSSAAPSRVFKGKKMPGRYGGGRVTVQNLLISDVRPEQHLLLLKGAVPGPNRSQVTVAQAVRKAAAGRESQAAKTDS
jgi:large subunit ribosomal protein L3